MLASVEDDGETTISFENSSSLPSATNCSHNDEIMENERISTVFDASFNFVNSIVGAGIIGLPFALKQCGFVSGIFMMTLVGYIANRSAVMLIECGVKENKLDYEELTEHVLGEYGYHAALISMFFFAYGAQIAYLLVIGDAVPLGIISSFIHSVTIHTLTYSVLFSLARYIWGFYILR